MNITDYSNTIIFTGGGSGGHWSPLISIKEYLTLLEKNNSSVRYKKNSVYIASKKDLENRFLTTLFDQCLVINVGKLRRYPSFKNLIDFFKVGIGIIQSLCFLIKIKNKKIIFSSGGYVALPVVIAGYLLKIPIIIHEQTARAGLANKISAKFAKRVLVSFTSSQQFYPKYKTTVIGYPIRYKFYENDVIKSTDNLSILMSLIQTAEKNKQKIILFGGGANGSQLINTVVKRLMPNLKKKYLVIHQVGKLSSDFKKKSIKNYYSFETIFNRDWIYLLKKINLFIGRSGAGTVHELKFLNKPAIYIPLQIAQKNEQYHNAKSIDNSQNVKIYLESEVNTTDAWNKIEKEFIISLKKLLNIKLDNKKNNDLNVANQIVDILLAEMR